MSSIAASLMIQRLTNCVQNKKLFFSKWADLWYRKRPLYQLSHTTTVPTVLFLVLKFLLDSPTTRHLNEIAIDIGAYSVVKDFISKGRGGGQVVCVLAFNSVDLSSNPTKIYNLSVKFIFK